MINQKKSKELNLEDNIFRFLEFFQFFVELVKLIHLKQFQINIQFKKSLFEMSSFSKQYLTIAVNL